MFYVRLLHTCILLKYCVTAVLKCFSLLCYIYRVFAQHDVILTWAKEKLYM